MRPRPHAGGPARALGAKQGFTKTGTNHLLFVSMFYGGGKGLVFAVAVVVVVLIIGVGVGGFTPLFHKLGTALLAAPFAISRTLANLISK